MNMRMAPNERKWVEAPKPLPNGVARAWMALEGGSAVAGVFEVIIGGQFMLSYHVLGEQRPRVQKYNSFEDAKAAAVKALEGCKVIPRAFTGSLVISGHA